MTDTQPASTPAADPPPPSTFRAFPAGPTYAVITAEEADQARRREWTYAYQDAAAAIGDEYPVAAARLRRLAYGILHGTRTLDRGRCREVLLADPAEWNRRERLADAARQWRDIPPVGDEELMAEREALTADLIGAVDALDRPTTGGPELCGATLKYWGGGAPAVCTVPAGHVGVHHDNDRNISWPTAAEPAPEPAGEYADDCLRTGAEVRARGETGCCRRCGYPAAAHPGDKPGAPDCDQPPEPAGDGPGWQRATVVAFIETVADDEIRPQLRALLADRDHQHDRRFALNQMLAEAWDQRDAARAELAEVTAQRDSNHRAINHLVEANRQLAAEPATARRDAAADTLAREAAQLARAEVWADPFGRWDHVGAMAAGEQKQLMVDRVLDAAAEIRNGTRPVPGSPQPANSQESSDANE